MLDMIKTSYFVKFFFNYLHEKTKLKLVKYNKSLQKIIDIKLINYKLFNERYIIYETKIKGKEYFDNLLLYEGEYLNGERNGKGKEYAFCDGLRFEGEFLKGKKWNGKVYDHGEIISEIKEGKGIVIENEPCSLLKYKGEYLNGKRNGKGIEYYRENDLIFKGEYKNGKNGMELDILVMGIFFMN